jgi:hypothetical protein
MVDMKRGGGGGWVSVCAGVQDVRLIVCSKVVLLRPWWVCGWVSDEVQKPTTCA